MKYNATLLTVNGVAFANAIKIRVRGARNKGINSTAASDIRGKSTISCFITFCTC